MRRTDREVTDDEKIDRIIKSNKICRLGLNDNGEIYVVPLNYGYLHKDGKRIFYFHSAKEGRKIELLRKCPKVGFEIDSAFELLEAKEACAFSANFQSIIGTGFVSEVSDYNGKVEGLTALMNTVSGQGEWKFDEHKVNAVLVFQLEVEKLSCKEHMQ